MEGVEGVEGVLDVFTSPAIDEELEFRKRRGKLFFLFPRNGAPIVPIVISFTRPTPPTHELLVS